MKSFVHLHTHSHYSLLDGLGKIPDLISRAKDLGMEALALTDHGVMYGAIEFYKECQAQGIKPIIGTEMYLATRRMQDKEAKIDNDQYHLVLLAKNEEGYQNLLKIVTAAHLEGFYYKPRVDKEFLKNHADGLIALTACLGGEIPRLVISKQNDRLAEAIKEYQEIFGTDFYLEIQHHPEIAEQKIVNDKFIQLAQELKIGLVATNDIHYVRIEDKDAHEVLLAVQTGKNLDDEARLSLKEFNLAMTSPEEMAANFADTPEALENTVKIAAICALEINLGQTILPKFPVPANQTSKTYLEKLCQEGTKKRYRQITQEIKERLDYELSVIEKCHFEDYFLIVEDYVKFAKDNGIIVGPGRGSAAGSLVAYVLGITDLDPIYYDIIFERFLNPERVAPPDFDLDFADDRRGEVIKYITDKYGVDHVAQIITFGVMKARMAIRDVARALGMGYDDGDRIAKLIPMGLTLDEALNTISELRNIYDNEPPFQKLIDMAKRLENVARNAGTHAAGVVISQQPLTDYVPLQFPPRGEENIITQYSMNYLEAIGLLKMDLLGLANLTIIKNTLRIVRKIAEQEIDMAKIPMDDPETFALLARAETSGVFQLESDGMKRYLKELKPTEFEDIISMVALYRPGPMESINDFIAAKHGRKKITYLDPKLEPILSKTYGVIVTQDQVLQIARAFAGFSYGQADILRKAVGKKIKKLLGEQKEKFIHGAIEEGSDRKTAQAVWDFIEPFARYGFNRAHAACYAMIAYQTAYLKAHFPSAFMAAWLTAEQQNIDKIAFAISECQRMGIEVLPPDVNESFVEFGVMKESGHIRFGLAAVKNVGVGVSEEIVEERKNNSPYLSFGDFVSRLGGRVLNKKVIEALAKAGALDYLAERNQILAQMEIILKFMANLEKSAQKNQMDLFENVNQPVAAELKLETIEPAQPKQRLAWERELLGIYLSEHPLKDIAEKLKSVTTPIMNLDGIATNKRVKVGGIIAVRRKIVTKNKESMMFVTLEDLTGKVEIVVFPRTLTQDTLIWQSDEPLVVEGRLDRRDNVPKVIAQSVFYLEKIEINPADEVVVAANGPAEPQKLIITLPRQTAKNVLFQIKEVLNKYLAGHEEGLAVYLRIPQNGTFEEIKTKTRVEFRPSLKKDLKEIIKSGRIDLE